MMRLTSSENQPPLAGSSEKYGLLLWWNLPSPRCQRGEIRTEADFGPSPCMTGTAGLPGYFAS
jgi:hypothetical protein